MCILAIYNRVSERWPLVVAANRDEFLDRPASPPGRLADDASIIAGIDLQAGGSWLGARVSGGLIIAAMINRRQAGFDAPGVAGARSRGELVINALRNRDTSQVDEYLGTIDGSLYAPFFFVTFAGGQAKVLNDKQELTRLGAGLSVVTNLGIDPPDCIRHAGALPRFRDVIPVLREDSSPQVLVDSLASVLSVHDSPANADDSGPLSGICVHADGYGTRSSTVIAVNAAGVVHYFHAGGPPCTSAFELLGTDPGP